MNDSEKVKVNQIISLCQEMLAEVVENPAPVTPEPEPEVPVPVVKPWVRDKSKLYDVNIYGHETEYGDNHGLGSPEAYAAEIVTNQDLWLDPAKSQFAPLPEAVQFIADWPQYFDATFKERWAQYFIK